MRRPRKLCSGHLLQNIEEIRFCMSQLKNQCGGHEWRYANKVLEESHWALRDHIFVEPMETAKSSKGRTYLIHVSLSALDPIGLWYKSSFGSHIAVWAMSSLILGHHNSMSSMSSLILGHHNSSCATSTFYYSWRRSNSLKKFWFFLPVEIIIYEARLVQRISSLTAVNFIVRQSNHEKWLNFPNCGSKYTIDTRTLSGS